jgi:hypothetical protein
MKITRIYNDSNGDSHFEDVVVALSDYGALAFYLRILKSVSYNLEKYT